MKRAGVTSWSTSTTATRAARSRGPRDSCGNSYFVATAHETNAKGAAMNELSREEVLDDLTRTTRARDLIQQIATDALVARDVFAEGLRRIRDTTDGPGACIAAHVLAEAGVPEPEDD